jgi:hypothetical protein
VLLPLTALFLAPPNAVDRANPLLALGWAVSGLRGRRRVEHAPAGRAAAPGSGCGRAAPGRTAQPGRPHRRCRRRGHRAGIAPDHALAGDDAARQRVVRLEYTVDRSRAGAATFSDVDDQLTAVVEAVRGYRRGPVPPAVVDPAAVTMADPVDEPSPATRTRMAVQSTLAVALAFLAGQTLLPGPGGSHPSRRTVHVGPLWRITPR